RTPRSRARQAAGRRAFAIDRLLAWFAGGRRSNGAVRRRGSSGAGRRLARTSRAGQTLNGRGPLHLPASEPFGAVASRPAGRYRPYALVARPRVSSIVSAPRQVATEWPVAATSSSTVARPWTSAMATVRAVAPSS